MDAVRTVDAHNLHQKVTKCSLFEHVLLDCKDKKLYKCFIEFINELLSQKSFEKSLVAWLPVGASSSTPVVFAIGQCDPLSFNPTRYICCDSRTNIIFFTHQGIIKECKNVSVDSVTSGLGFVRTNFRCISQRTRVSWSLSSLSTFRNSH